MNSLAAQLDQLESAQLVRHLIEEEPAYTFRHTLTQEASYDSLLKNQRREIHRAVAQAYEKVYADRCLDEFAAILARHYAEAGDAEQTLVFASHAGDVAARVYANTEAIAFYSQALGIAKERTDNAAKLISLYTRLGRAYELAADYPRALEIYREMETLGQTRGERGLALESLVLQTTAYAVGSGGVRNLDMASDASARALALAEELNDRQAQSRIYWNLLLINRFGRENPSKAVEYGEKSLALARELGLTEQIALTLKDLMVAYVLTGKVELAQANQAETLALWRQLNNTPMLAEALIGNSQHFFGLARLDESIQMGEESYALNQSIGNRHGLSLSGSFLWYPYRERGHFQQAIEIAEESITIAEEMNFVGPQMHARVELAATFDWLGDFMRATQYAERGRVPSVPHIFVQDIFARAVLAMVSLHHGNLAAATAWLPSESSEALEDKVQFNPAGASQLACAHIELMIALGQAERAAAYADEAIAFNRRRSRTVWLLPLWHLKSQALRALKRTDEAYAILNDAREQAEQIQSRYRLLPILLTLLELETERGDTTQAQVRRDEARGVIQFIADHTPPDLREIFLNKPDVHAAMTV